MGGSFFRCFMSEFIDSQGNEVFRPFGFTSSKYDANVSNLKFCNDNVISF